MYSRISSIRLEEDRLSRVPISSVDMKKSSKRIHADIARQIGISIVTGRYRPDEVLPGEIESSEFHNVSRAAYREAVRILSAKGLVESRPKTGTRVLARSKWSLLDPDVVGWFFEIDDPDEAFLNSLFELRVIVEPAAAALAAERRSPNEIEEMRAALAEMERHTLGTPQGRAADRLFHDTILKASGNEVLLSLSTGIGAAVRWTTLFKYRNRDLPRDPVPDHYAVFDSIVAKDAEGARAAMRKLVDLALGDIQLTIRSASSG